MAELSVDIKSVIIKYLKQEWDEADLARIKEIRYDTASRAVPRALANSGNSISSDQIEEYIQILTEEPTSEKGQHAITYISDLQSKGHTQDYVRYIDDKSKLTYLNEKFFAGESKIIYGLGYKQNNIDVNLMEGKVKIESKYSWDIVSTLVPDSKITAYFQHFGTLDLDFSYGEAPKVELEPGVSSEQVVNSAIDKYREILLSKFDKMAEESRKSTKGIHYEITFDEGLITNGKIEINKYSPRIITMLDTILG